MSEVRVSYDFSQWPAFDDVIKQSIGRSSDFSGTDGCTRDHGWNCGSEIEQEKIVRALKKLGLSPVVKP